MPRSPGSTPMPSAKVWTSTRSSSACATTSG